MLLVIAVIREMILGMPRSGSHKEAYDKNNRKTTEDMRCYGRISQTGKAERSLIDFEPFYVQMARKYLIVDIQNVPPLFGVSTNAVHSTLRLNTRCSDDYISRGNVKFFCAKTVLAANTNLMSYSKQPMRR